MITVKKHGMPQSGSITLISVIIFGAIIELMLLSLSSDISLYQETVSSAESREIAILNNFSCAAIAKIRLSSVRNYSGNETFDLWTSTCSVTSILVNNSNTLIGTNSLVNNSLVNMETMVDQNLNSISMTEKQ